ncbi:hypothetical protein ACFE04_013533 [Oxalis oulophora]
MENEAALKRRKVSEEEVITKLKDDGDFDNLRLKIIRKLKDDKELRNNIISVVKQAAVLQRPRVENVKPRQLSDMIFEEIRDKAMSQVSDCAWEIMRSNDGMRGEIVETVQTVYSKLANPEGIPDDTVPANKEPDHIGLITLPNGEAGHRFSENDPDEPPGFTLSNNHPNGHGECHKEEQLVQKGKELLCNTEEVRSDVNMGASQVVRERKEPCDGSDDDPDVPPGFG